MGEKDLLTLAQAQLLKPLAEEELYDLENDPYETVNLVGNKEFEAVRKELKDNLSEWVKLSKDKGLEKDSDAIVQHFKNYGTITMERRAKSIQKMRSSVEKYFE